MTIRYSKLFADLSVARRLVVDALVDRGFPDSDAERVAQAVLELITANPVPFSEVLFTDDERAYLERMALSVYLAQLRQESRGRPDGNVV